MKHSEKIVIIDFGMGNLWSVMNAFRFLGRSPVISDDPRIIAAAEALVLPGVGSYRLAMQALNERQLVDVIVDRVKSKRSKILGICLGFQMLAQSSMEDGYSLGLGLMPGVVERFSLPDLKGKKLPHIGFNRVAMPSSNGLFSGFDSASDFYFVHSYRLLPEGLPGESAICQYGTDFVAAYQDANVYGCQFHPEKSQTNGLRLLNNFLVA